MICTEGDDDWGIAPPPPRLNEITQEGGKFTGIITFEGKTLCVLIFQSTLVFKILPSIPKQKNSGATSDIMIMIMNCFQTVLI